MERGKTKEKRGEREDIGEERGGWREERTERRDESEETGQETGEWREANREEREEMREEIKWHPVT